MSRETISILQAGRALAALAVVGHHAALGVTGFVEPVPEVLAALLDGGYLGVDFFFVLSGFIIYWSTEGKTPRSYAASRARRIYIPYLPIGLAMAALYTLSPGHHEWNWLPTLTLFPIKPGPALGVAWTLQYEIQFYSIFGILFFAGKLREGLALWAVLIVVASMFGIVDIIPLDPLNLEFLFGVLAAVAVKRGLRVPYWIVPIPFVFWLLLGAQRDESPLVGLSLAFLIIPLAAADLKGSIRTPETLLFLGAASYSIYLIHSPAISFLARLVPGLHWWAALPALFVAAVLCGCIYHWFYERPALKLTLRRCDTAARVQA